MQKVIIVDDESAGRKLIKQYLTDFPNFVLLGEANNGVDAIGIINKFKPDLVFLDIQMPGMTGFEVLSHLREIPPIIFSTAYDQYAIKAFEVHAVDYLLKPYTKERFKTALTRVQTTASPRSLQPLATDLIMEKQEYPQRILVAAGRKLITIATNSIVRIEADGDYSKLITGSGNHLSSYGISKLEDKLDPQHFLRVHRSSIININYVESVYRQSSSYDVVMKNQDVVRVSRGYLDKIKRLMI